MRLVRLDENLSFVCDVNTLTVSAYTCKSADEAAVAMTDLLRRLIVRRPLFGGYL